MPSLHRTYLENGDLMVGEEGKKHIVRKSGDCCLFQLNTATMNIEHCYYNRVCYSLGINFGLVRDQQNIYDKTLHWYEQASSYMERELQ